MQNLGLIWSYVGFLAEPNLKSLLQWLRLMQNFEQHLWIQLCQTYVLWRICAKVLPSKLETFCNCLIARAQLHAFGSIGDFFEGTNPP